MSKLPARFRFESLETRQMMAGDVAAYVQNGTLYLNEAAAQAGRDNAVMVSHLANGKVRVEGITAADGAKSRINGAAFKDFTVANSVFVSFGGGNDTVFLVESSDKSFKDVNIDLSGPGITNAPAAKTSKPAGGTVVNPSDNDYVALLNANVQGSLHIQTGLGADQVQVLGGKFGHGPGQDKRFNVNTGAGADQVEVSDIDALWLSGFDVQTYSLANESDADSVTLRNVNTFSHIGVRLGGGNDGFNLTNVNSYGSIGIDAGAGSDNGVLDHVYAGYEVMARLGEGQDSLRLDNVSAYKLSLLGDGGHDRLTKTDAVSYTILELTSWEYINGIPQWPT
jgi:hypothetical protein